MEKKFTQGEWTTGDTVSGAVWCSPKQNGIVKPKEIFIASVYPHDTHSKEELEERLANMKLIAAAPDLLEACIEFCRKVEAGEAKSKRSYAQMKSAIQKATT